LANPYIIRHGYYCPLHVQGLGLKGSKLLPAIIIISGH
jgi:hypothetical protein